MDSQQSLLVNSSQGSMDLGDRKAKRTANLDHSDASENSSDLVKGHLGFDPGRLLKILVVVVTAHSPGGRRFVVVATDTLVLFSSFRCRFNNFASTSAFPPLFKDLNVISKYRSCSRTYVMASNSVTSLSNGTASMDPEPRRTYQVLVAATHDMGIGKDGVLPWRLPSDLKFFKELTVTTSDPGKKNAIVMGRKTWESIPSRYRPLPGRLNVVLTRSGSFDISTDENVVICGSILSALELLAQAPYLLSIEKVFLIGGGQILRDSLNAPGCDAIHITEIETSMECDTFIPAIDRSLFQPWYSSQPLSENGIRFSFVTYARVKKFAIGTTTVNSELEGNGSSNYNKFEVKNFTFLPKLILEKHDEYMYLRLVKEIISSGNQKDDRTRTGTLSKFGCQIKLNLRRSFPLLTTKRVFLARSC